MAVQVDAGHLGGYIPADDESPHGDDATYYPDLWRWLKEGPLQVKSVLDIGCGEGHSLRYFRDDLKLKTQGVDGVPQEDKNISVHDFAEGPYVTKRKFDLVWACEFVEHVEERYIRNVIPAFRAGKVVLMTHAFPGQLGHHHVNCRMPDYWKGFMAAAGFEWSPGLTDKSREIASMNGNVYNHYLRSGLAFRRLDG